jgi:choline kinase
MKTIVLAAGTGSRLGEITSARTKGMLPVNGKKLIDYLLDFIDIESMDEILIVGGFCYEDLKFHVEQRNLEKIRVLENKEYLKGNIFTLITALREFSGSSFLLTNVDHVYPRIMFDTMKDSFSGITAMCDFDRTLGADDMKVKLTGDTTRIAHISKQLDDFDCGYIGMTYVDHTQEQLYRQTIDKVLATYGEKAVVENILHLLAEQQVEAPRICDLSGFGWYEIDTPDELKDAEAKIVHDPHFT